MARTFKEVLSEAGISMDFEAGGKAPAALTDREIQREPHERVKYLKERYMEALSSINNEFPYWYTREYMRNDLELPVVRRALALKAGFSHLTPAIYPKELLTMRKGPFVRGSFAMPWLTNSFFLAQGDALYQAAMKSGSASAGEHSKFGAGGGNVTQSFGNVVSVAGKCGVRQEEVGILVKLAHMWQDKSVEQISNRYERMVPGYDIKEQVMRSLVCMFDSGFTLPQGREVINYYYPLEYGFDGIVRMCEEKMAECAGDAGGDGMVGTNRLYNYYAVKLVIEGVQAWIENYAAEARRLAGVTPDKQQATEYAAMAERLQHIAHHQPRTFIEALQMVETLHIAVVNEDAISGMSVGRLGQVLYPWFEQDIAAGRITEDEVLELLEQDRILKTSIDPFASTGVVGGVLSGNSFNTLSVGGVNRRGESAVNRLEYLILEAGVRNAMPQSTIALHYDERLPEDFLLLAMDVIKSGAGYPAFMNNDVAEQFFMQHYACENITLEEARAWSIGGCLESQPGVWKTIHLNGKAYEVPGGACQPTSVGIHFLAMPKILELTLFNGVDQRTKAQVYPPHNRTLSSYEEVWDQFKLYWQLSCKVLELCNNLQHDIWRKNNMAVFNSMLKPGCLDSGHLINELGYRFNATYNVESCGTVTWVNSMAALKKLVFEEKQFTLDEVREAMVKNFGFKTAHEVNSFSISDQQKREDDDGRFNRLHFALLQAPKYGNDDKAADEVLLEWENWFCDDCANYQSLYAKPMYACQISVSTHGAQGSATCATPDGRLAGTTYADASMSAYPGTDRNGPFALLSSATVWDHSMSQNSQMNVKIHPTAIRGPEGSKKLLDLIRAYMRKGGFHIQFNVVDTKVLRDAQAHPENYRDLMVRVAGFTQYWVEIGKSVQDELIARTEYEGF